MAAIRNFVFVLSLLVIATQSAPRDYENPLIRAVRSPRYEPCDQNNQDRGYGPPEPPPPPPPPRYFHHFPHHGYGSHQWTGYARSPDGGSQGVFSGATASLNQESQAHGEAYSIAASEAGTFNNNNKNNFSQSLPKGRQDVDEHHSGYQNQQQLSKGQDFNQDSKKLESSRLSSDNNKNNVGQSQQEQEHQQDFGQNHVGYQNQKQFPDHVNQDLKTGDSSRYSNYHQQDVSGNRNQQDYSSIPMGYGQAASDASSQSNSGSSAHGDLKGAMNLAAQGLEASKLNSGSGCDTCGKSTYALSNAKSDSGSAVAISVGG